MWIMFLDDSGYGHQPVWWLPKESALRLALVSPALELLGGWGSNCQKNLKVNNTVAAWDKQQTNQLAWEGRVFVRRYMGEQVI